MERVVKIRGPNGVASVDLVDMARYYLDLTPTAGSPGYKQARLSDTEIEVLTDHLVAMRDILGVPDQIVYHQCRHDESANDCASIAVYL